MTATKRIVYIALLAALVCVISPFSIPIGAVPLSLGSLAVYIAACSVSGTCGVAAVAVYVLLGAFGVPVFSGFGAGFAKIAGPTGGYIIGYIPCAAIIGFTVDRLENKTWAYTVAMIVGTVVLYAFGSVWFMKVAGADFKTTMLACVVPFLAGDALKIIFATFLCKKLRFTLKKTLTVRK